MIDYPSSARATRDAYGAALIELGNHSDVVVINADLSASTRTRGFEHAHPERFFNVGVAEQNLIGVAAGLALTGYTVFASTFAVFASCRAADQVRNTVCLNNLNVKIVATHAGLTVGEDGASHQALEDIAIMRAFPNMRVIVPSDYEETLQVIRYVASAPGPFYVRLGRVAAPALPVTPHRFQLGCAAEIRPGRDAYFVACGLMVNEAYQAAAQLEGEGYHVGVLAASSVKPLDANAVLAAGRRSGLLITVEEHSVLGGLGGAVAETVGETGAMRIVRLGTPDVFGQSGDARSLLDSFGLTSQGLATTVQRLLAARSK